MNQDWRLTAKSVTKYNPRFRDGSGVFQKEEWIGFFQVGTSLNGKVLTFEEYEKVEARYIQAARCFFSFHGCNRIKIASLEKNADVPYEGPGQQEMKPVFDTMEEGGFITGEKLDTVIKLILREVLWAELLCGADERVAVRFGYDLYMYFNSPYDFTALNPIITELGLFVC